MSLFVIGLNHRTAGIELRERLAIPSCKLSAALREARELAGLQETVILSTCNRIELYGVSSNPEAAARAIEYLAIRGRTAVGLLEPSLYYLVDQAMVSHLLRVAAGLDSMIFGESEVTVQLKQAYQTALAGRAVGPVLNRLFQKALHAAKIIRSQTRIAEGAASVGSVVADAAKRAFGDKLRECTVLLWGAGKAAEITARQLIKTGIRRLWIANRTEVKAQELANVCRGQVVVWEQAMAQLGVVDIAVIGTQAPHYVIDAQDMAQVLPRRQGRPLLIVDLAVPRNVDPAIRSQRGVQLYNVDELQSTAQRALATRQQERERCESLIETQAGYFLEWLAREQTPGSPARWAHKQRVAVLPKADGSQRSHEEEVACQGLEACSSV